MSVRIAGREVFNDADINNPDIDGGTIDNTIIGATTATTGKFTSVTTPIVKPASDGTTAVQIDDKDGNAILNVDTTNDRVGIGTTGPEQKLSVKDGYIQVEKLVNVSNTEVGQLVFRNLNFNLGTQGGDIPAAIIVSTGSYVNRGILQFATSNNDIGATVKVTIDNLGNVGIGTTSPTSTLHNAGSFASPITTKTADYTATSSDHTILCNKSDGNITITLPAVSGCSGRIYNIKKIDSSAYTVTIDGNSSETIDGALTQTLTTQYESITIQTDGSAWYII